MNFIISKYPKDQTKGSIYLGNIWSAEKLIKENTLNIKSVLTVAEYTNLKYDKSFIN